LQQLAKICLVAQKQHEKGVCQGKGKNGSEEGTRAQGVFESGAEPKKI